ncbi:kidney mitochondrial carrier protein 1-like isoform X2 [Syngnathoides biaculeatus]|uniref:kidney mitochondrial carrier protein 1-like isoform X2 n=1 Tax=Syngnathoides biaculeatus TaxID=300417 RepID=UPI002ADE12BC|nr:kidney mitochondrial carrier protein 1-like isoform X2 [Syngnathoides biaculeatus]
MWHVPHRPRQDAPSGSGPSGRQQAPRDPLPRDAARHRQDSARGGRPGALFRSAGRVFRSRAPSATCALLRIAPATLRQASYGTVKIGVYQSLKRLLVERPQDETMATNVLCGVLAGVISSTIANPTDVLKIRMQAQGSLIQGSMMGHFVHIYQQEGTRGLWKGVSLTAQRAAIVVGVELPVYDITKKHLILSGHMGDNVYAHFLSSFVCGLAGALASNPVDVVRTRMMNQRGAALYHGTLDCVLQATRALLNNPRETRSRLLCTGLVFQTWRSEGLAALYKGFIPNWFRLGPWNIIFFVTYEQLRKLEV